MAKMTTTETLAVVRCSDGGWIYVRGWKYAVGEDIDKEVVAAPTSVASVTSVPVYDYPGREPKTEVDDPVDDSQPFSELFNRRPNGTATEITLHGEEHPPTVSVDMPVGDVLAVLDEALLRWPGDSE